MKVGDVELYICYRHDLSFVTIESSLIHYAVDHKRGKKYRL